MSSNNAPDYNLNWSDIAFSNKKPLNKLQPIFIVAPRQLSKIRFTQLVKECLKKGNILLGIATEDYVVGFEKQPHFKTLKLSDVAQVINKVNESNIQNKIYTINYSQRDLLHIISGLKFSKVLFIRGSWAGVMHRRPEYYQLVKTGVKFKLLSPFASAQEATDYAAKYTKVLYKNYSSPQVTKTKQGMIELVDKIKNCSFDYTYQTGAVLAVKKSDSYHLLLETYNKVLPYETYALHNGSQREINFSPPNDLNNYDTIHAEVDLVVQMQKKKHTLKNTALFINLMPCPTCTKMLMLTDIKEVYYKHDHSDGYAIKMLTEADIKVTRLSV